LKTKIITLESHDDLISVRDRLSWAKTPRILLVWPKYEKVTLRLLDLKVLQRHADSLGAQLGLVTRRANVRRDAESLGIPVFKSTADAQKQAWTPPKPRVRRIPPPPRRDLRQMRAEVHEQEPAWRTSLLGRVITFTIGVTAVLALASLLVPRAAVTLHPEMRSESIVIPVSASPAFDHVSITGNIPAHTVSVTVEAEQSKSVTSEIAQPRTKARGVTQFKNLTASETIIPAGTVVGTETNVRFATLNETRLPAGADEIVEVRVEALEAGSGGNVEAGAIVFVEGALGLSVTVTNPEPTTGGTDTKAVGASDADREQLREAVMEELQRMALDQIRAQIEAGGLLLPDTLEIGEILIEEFSPPAGEAGKTVALKMQAEFSALTISHSDLERLAGLTLTAAIPAGFEPFGAAVFEPLSTPAVDASDAAHFELKATQTALRKIDVFRVFSVIRGLEPQPAKSELMRYFPLREEPQITVTPSWWKWLPLIPFNLSLELK
jgi:hypothetical protein